jgi:hypothetical protein
MASFRYAYSVRVFISWSGPRSEVVAKALHTWVPQIINAVQPWLSTEDIRKGKAWIDELRAGIKGSKVGIICLTPGNLGRQWLLFEAGALTEALPDSYVCTLLINVERSQLVPPLSVFQDTRVAEKDDVRKLLHTINSAFDEKPVPDKHIDSAFDQWWWEKFSESISNLPAEAAPASPLRGQQEMIEDILELVRELARRPTAPPPVGVPPLVPILGRRGLLSARFSRALQAKAEAVCKMLVELDRVDEVGDPITDGTRLSINVALRGLGIVPIVFDDLSQPMHILKKKAEKAIANEGINDTFDLLDPLTSS